MLNFDKLLNPLRGYFYEAEGSGGGGQRDSSDGPSGGSAGDGGRGEGSSGKPSGTSQGSSDLSADSIEGDFGTDFGGDSDTGGLGLGGGSYDPQSDNQFSVSAGTSFGGFGEGQSNRDSGYSVVDASIGGGMTVSEGFARGIGDSTGSFSSGFGKEVEDIRSFSEKVDAFFSYEIPKFFDEFKAAPLDTISDIVSNPLIGTAASFLGGGIAVAGIKALDAAVDAFQGEQTMVDAAKQAIAGGIASPLGAGLGPLQGVAAQVAAGPENAGRTIAGFAGGMLGGTVGGTIGASFGNPYAAAVASAAGAVGGKMGALSIADRATDGSSRATGFGNGSEDSPAQVAQRQQEGSSNRRVSPLVPDQPKAPEATPTKLARQVNIERFNPKAPSNQTTFNPYVGEVYRG